MSEQKEAAAMAIAREAGAVWPQDADRYRRYAAAALTTARAEAEAKDAEIARLREAGNVLRDKLLGFVGAMAMYADCGPDVEAIKAWEAI